MLNLFAQLLDLIYKKHCYFCRSTSDNSIMCKKCFDEIELLSPKNIDCETNVPVFSASIYGKNMQKMIRGLKYHTKRELAFFQAKLMFNFWNTLTDKKEKYLIVPVPLFKSRERKRKYNHMQLVAQEFSKLTGYEIKNNLVKRIKDTKPQYRLTVSERQANLANAFKVEKKYYNGENILIIDDILTTGSTLCEIVNELKRSGISNITCFTTSCTASHV